MLFPSSALQHTGYYVVMLHWYVVEDFDGIGLCLVLLVFGLIRAEAEPEFDVERG